MLKRMIGLLMIASTLATPRDGSAQDNLKFVASFSILADVAQQVAGDAAVVTTLMPLSTDPHSFEPKPRDVATLAEADVVLVNGLGFEQSLLETIENAGEDVNIVAVSACVPTLLLGEEPDHEEAATVQPTDQCTAHQAELGDLGIAVATADQICSSNEDHEEDHDHGGCDPHVWTDPINVMYWTLLIRDTLSAHDPGNAATYAANAAAYLQTLSELNTEIIAQVETIPAASRILVTNHDTLNYFAHRYGFEVVGVVMAGGSSLAEPGARDIAMLIDLIRETGVQAVFAENTLNANLAEQIANEADAQFYTLYTDSLSEAAPSYVDYLRYNVATITGALGQ